LPPAHGPELQQAELDHPAFQDHPDAVDLPVRAGDLVINDARLLHGAWPNRTGHRRTLLLQWHSVFRFPHPPSWWEGDIPDEVRNADPDATYPYNRVPGKYLK
jgi:ectoine hydroxylase-related dioxygenase (phytanoyl-CoA dioxygenase family)